VIVREGDWVEVDQPLARLAAWDEERDLAVAKATLEKAAAELRVLQEGPKPEEIALAESGVAAAKARITFTKAEADRQSRLVKSGTASKREAEHALSEYRKDLADLAVAEANLAKVRSGATASMIAAAQAEVAKLQQQVAYLETQIERTVVRATMAGRVVTPNIELQRGMYLTVGTLFATIERSQMAQAEILVPETDMGEIQIGDSVRLKPWGDSAMEILGEVVAIAPTAEKTAYGPIVRVKTEIDNTAGFLRSDMTGYAKIAGSDMPVWEAYTRLFVRFFNIEVWSWIP
jgi:multidrug resistance efflux pump